MQIGSIVYSKAGRDKGRMYMLLDWDEAQGRALVVDGDVKTIANPKKKNARHLHYKGEDLEALADKLKQGKQIFDSEIKSALRQHADK